MQFEALLIACATLLVSTLSIAYKSYPSGLAKPSREYVERVESEIVSREDMVEESPIEITVEEPIVELSS